MTYVVGLTGGIGCGKTVVSNYFQKLGITIIDTDIIAREIVEPGKPCLSALSDAFGQQIIDQSGHLDRTALRTIAFNHTNNKKKLDAITHPVIHTETIQQIAKTNTVYCIVVIPLLTATSPYQKLIKQTLVVTAKESIKIERVMKRNNISKNEVISIMNTQISDSERMKFADDIIENNGTIEEAQQAAAALHSKYLKLAAS